MVEQVLLNLARNAMQAMDEARVAQPSLLLQVRVAGATALTIDAGRTLVLDGADVTASANEAGIAIVGRPPQEQRVN